MKKLKKLLLLLTMASVFTLNTTGVFAHGIHHHNEGTVFSVEYDDGEPVKNAVVLVYDKSGEQIHEGKTDEDGCFDYGQIDGAAKLVANDGNGHQAEFEMDTLAVTENIEKTSEETTEELTAEKTESEVEESQDNSKIVTVVIVLVALGAIAGVFYARNKKVNK